MVNLAGRRVTGTYGDNAMIGFNGAPNGGFMGPAGTNAPQWPRQGNPGPMGPPTPMPGNQLGMLTSAGYNGPMPGTPEFHAALASGQHPIEQWVMANRSQLQAQFPQWPGWNGIGAAQNGPGSAFGNGGAGMMPPSFDNVLEPRAPGANGFGGLSPYYRRGTKY